MSTDATSSNQGSRQLLQAPSIGASAGCQSCACRTRGRRSSRFQRVNRRAHEEGEAPEAVVPALFVRRVDLAPVEQRIVRDEVDRHDAPGQEIPEQAHRVRAAEDRDLEGRHRGLGPLVAPPVPARRLEVEGHEHVHVVAPRGERLGKRADDVSEAARLGVRDALRGEMRDAQARLSSRGRPRRASSWTSRRRFAPRRARRPVTAPFETVAVFGSEVVQARAASSMTSPVRSLIVAVIFWVSPTFRISVTGVSSKAPISRCRTFTSQAELTSLPRLAMTVVWPSAPAVTTPSASTVATCGSARGPLQLQGREISLGVPHLGDERHLRARRPDERHPDRRDRERRDVDDLHGGAGGEVLESRGHDRAAGRERADEPVRVDGRDLRLVGQPSRPSGRASGCPSCRRRRT